MIKLKCHHCKTAYSVTPATAKWNKIRKHKLNFCSRGCKDSYYSGTNSPMWNNGRNISAAGYIRIMVEDEPCGYRYEHRLVMEEKLGRRLTYEEQIHHINGIKTDNRIENLLLTTKSDHPKLYNQVKRGEQHTGSKLNEQQVLEIRQKYKPRKVTLQKLADEYGVCFQLISLIVNRKVWQHI